MAKQHSDQIIHEKLSPDFERSIASLDNLMVVVCDFSNGPMKQADPPHFHQHEQITYVAEGELEFYKGDKKYILKTGDIVVIPSGIPHCIKTLSTNVRLVDSFSPVRKDFLK
jgi:quercetin dioxygenase-like cupin family protein